MGAVMMVGFGFLALQHPMASFELLQVSVEFGPAG
jgi:hypothetical protein